MPTWITAKLIGYAVAGLLTFGVLWKVYAVADNYFNEVSNTRIELANERIKRERADTSLTLLLQSLELETKHNEELKQLQTKYEEQIKQLRVDSAAQIAVLEDRERLARVTSEKPKLVEKLANKATKERFRELEDAINN